ncbi:MAG: hypothetical protein M1419_04815 [Bacteroidetes bacterium]|nr:hypothetical protein [Bacteroidota bacterium]
MTKIYEQTMNSLALLKILAISSKNLNKGRIKSLNEAFKDIRKKMDKEILENC